MSRKTYRACSDCRGPLPTPEWSRCVECAERYCGALMRGEDPKLLPPPRAPERYAQGTRVRVETGEIGRVGPPRRAGDRIAVDLDSGRRVFVRTLTLASDDDREGRPKPKGKWGGHRRKSAGVRGGDGSPDAPRETGLGSGLALPGGGDDGPLPVLPEDARRPDDGVREGEGVPRGSGLVCPPSEVAP